MTHLASLHQGQEFPHLVHGPIAAGEDNQGAGRLSEPEFAHEKVLEQKIQFRGYIGVRFLLQRQLDVEADG